MNRNDLARVPSFDPLRFRIDDAGQADFDAGFFLQHRPALIAHLPSGSVTPYMELIVCWYVLHRAQGGARNHALDQTLRTEDTESRVNFGYSASRAVGFARRDVPLTA